MATPEAALKLEARLAALETEVAQLKQQVEKPAEPQKHWVTEIYGAFAGNEDFLEAMRLGRQHRKLLRPKDHTKSAKLPTKRKK